jgi:uncharacterized protein YqeY
MRTVDELKLALKTALTEAMRARRKEIVSALRETLAALDNAEAADLFEAPEAEPGVIAGGVKGLGAGEVARKALTPEDAARVVEAELAERRAAAVTFERLGRADEATTLKAQIEALEGLLR